MNNDLTTFFDSVNGEPELKNAHFLLSLYKEISGQSCVDELIETISLYLRTPVCLLDTSLRFLSKSNHYKPDASSVLPDLPSKPGFDDTLLELYRKDGGLGRLLHAEDFFCYQVGNEKGYFIPVFVSGMKVAYLVIYTMNPDDKLDELYGNCFLHLSEILGLKLSRENFYLMNKGSYFSYIFSMLLSGEGTDRSDVEMRLRLYNHNLKEAMYLIAVEPCELRPVAEHKDKIADMLRELFGNCIYLVRESYFLFLLSRDSSDPPTDKQKIRWERALKAQNLYAVMTGPFTGTSEVPERFRKTELLLHMMQTHGVNRNLYCYEDCLTQALLTAVETSYDLRLFCFAPLMRVVAYDRRRGTELTETLKEYLKHPKKIGEICEKLCVHRNTLYKRLDKISDLMGCGFEDGQTITQIEMTFNILEMINGVH